MFGYILLMCATQSCHLTIRKYDSWYSLLTHSWILTFHCLTVFIRVKDISVTLVGPCAKLTYQVGCLCYEVAGRRKYFGLRDRK